MVPEPVEDTTRRFDKLSDQLSSKFNSLRSKFKVNNYFCRAVLAIVLFHLFSL